MKEQKFVTNLTKGHGEGSWTRIDIPFDVEMAFGKKRYIQVKGKIDDYEFTNIKLMTGGKGKHWLPVNEKIRKAINKSAGDSVAVALALDMEKVIFEIPEDFATELQKSPNAAIFFYSLTESYQKWFIQSVTEAKQAETRKKRIGNAIEKLTNRKKFHD